MRRREFLVATGSAVAGSVACWNEARTAQVPLIERVGLQLYTARAWMGRDFEGTLARVASIGYREVEFAGYFDRAPADLRAMLDAHGLDAPGTHVGLEAFGSDWDRTLRAAETLRHRYVILPDLPPGQRTADGYRAVAATLNARGADARSTGILVGYHNHDFDHHDLGGTTGFDILLEETDPEVVAIEMDLFWTVKGGRDPLDYFARFPGRFPLVHVKDMDAAGRMVDPGRGQIDFPAIVDHARQAGIRHWFVEHDDPTNIEETLRMGYAYLNAMGR